MELPYGNFNIARTPSVWRYTLQDGCPSCSSYESLQFVSLTPRHLFSTKWNRIVLVGVVLNNSFYFSLPVVHSSASVTGLEILDFTFPVVEQDCRAPRSSKDPSCATGTQKGTAIPNVEMMRRTFLPAEYTGMGLVVSIGSFFLLLYTCHTSSQTQSLI